MKLNPQSLIFNYLRPSPISDYSLAEMNMIYFDKDGTVLHAADIKQGLRIVFIVKSAGCLPSLIQNCSPDLILLGLSIPHPPDHGAFHCPGDSRIGDGVCYAFITGSVSAKEIMDCEVLLGIKTFIGSPQTPASLLSKLDLGTKSAAVGVRTRRMSQRGSVVRSDPMVAA
jgi:hypothetical protein